VGGGVQLFLRAARFCDVWFFSPEGKIAQQSIPVGVSGFCCRSPSPAFFGTAPVLPDARPARAPRAG
jgi:hypothetical protein